MNVNHDARTCMYIRVSIRYQRKKWKSGSVILSIKCDRIPSLFQSGWLKSMTWCENLSWVISSRVNSCDLRCERTSGIRHERPIEASGTRLGSNRCKAQITFKQKFPRGIISLSVKRLLSPRKTTGKMDGAPSDSQLLYCKADWRFVLCQGRRQLFVSKLSVFNRFQHLIKCTILQGETLQNSATVELHFGKLTLKLSFCFV